MRGRTPRAHHGERRAGTRPHFRKGGMATLGRGSKFYSRGAEFHDATVSNPHPLGTHRGGWRRALMGDEATLAADASAIRVGGPFYEDLELGQVFDAAPGLTLT